jgi:hypothetical protein
MPASLLAIGIESRVTSYVPVMGPYGSVVDPHHFNADPDSTYQPDADLDANPDSGFYLMRIRIRVFTLMCLRIQLSK